ncbi:DedA family protein [Candidatus Babeliales bacterium]|nr:DedA family protein [Candidatus Babeliales bacterium]
MRAFAVWDWGLSRIRSLYDWMGQQVDSPYATWILGVFFFIEAIFFFPADPLLILFCVKKRKKAWLYATVATITSVLGGILGYYIGYGVWHIIGHKLVAVFSTEQTFHALCKQYALYQTWAVLIAGFTPVPYKLVTLTAGFCKLPLLPFILCSFIARGARFYLVGGIIYVWGDTIKEYIDHYFNLLVGIFTLLVVSTFIIFI